MGKLSQNYESANVNSGIATADIEAYRLVKMGTNEGEVTPCTAIDDVAIGVSLNKVSAGQQCNYQTKGIALITTSTGVTRGAQVMATAAGAGKCSTASGATARSAGIALGTTTTGDDQQIAVAINLPNLNGPANS